MNTASNIFQSAVHQVHTISSDHFPVVINIGSLVNRDTDVLRDVLRHAWRQLRQLSNSLYIDKLNRDLIRLQWGLQLA